QDADQRGLACAVGPQQREDFTAFDVEVHIAQGMEPAGVGFRQVGDRDNGGHRVSGGGGGRSEVCGGARAVRHGGQERAEGTAPTALRITRRVCCGSMTASISSWVAASVALPRWYSAASN